MIDALCAFDIFTGRINFVRLRPPREMRDVNVVAEPSYGTEYLRSQPLARLRSIMNNYANQIRFDSKSRFKSFVTEKFATFNDETVKRCDFDCDIVIFSLLFYRFFIIIILI